MITKRAFLSTVAMAGTAATGLDATAFQPALAQSYPSNVIRIVVPNTPSTPPDIMSRIVAAELSTNEGWRVIVENRPGGVMTIAGSDVLRQPPDGYSIYAIAVPAMAAPALLANMPFRLDTDFAPLIKVSVSYNVLVVNPSVPAKSVSELVALLKSRPDKMTFSSGGYGTPAHLIGELFKLETGVRATHVPYQQFSQAIGDLLNGTNQYQFITMLPVVEFIKAGKLRALAITGPKRVQALPEVPTIVEAGFPSLVVEDWVGFLVKTGTPDAIVRLRFIAPLMLAAAERLRPIIERPITGFDPDTRGSLLHSYALIRQSIGEQSGSNDNLIIAISAHREALQEWTRERVPLQWATTQNNLGSALQTLGERESGAARLDEAVAAFCEALKEWTRERVPLQWATTQNNLGNALRILGERENGTARLDEAVAACREALKEWTRERVPLDWAGTQNNLGNALQTLGRRESGTARLDEAVAAFREALKEWTRERVPLQWATTQNNLGNALLALGERESGTARLDEAVAAFREALKEWTRERVPLDWAMTQNNLGNALLALGRRESGTARLDEAVAAFREALQERTRERVPLDWAMTQNNLGNALQTLGERESGTARLDEAVAAYRSALEVFEQARASYYIETTRGNLARAEAALATRRSS